MKPAFLFLILAAGALLLNLGLSGAGGFIGFPLDDAWIHQTYARNLAATGQMAFLSGQPSAGSTSPLWTAALAAGYWLRVDYRAWTYALGGLLLALTAWLVYRLSLRLWPERPRAALAAGIFAALEWHLAWGAASGMETLLFSALALAALCSALPAQVGGAVSRWAAAWAGLLAGLSILARPDGLTLLPFVLASVALSYCRDSARAAAAACLICLAAFGAVLLPYLAANQLWAGAFWPNTFYAKQAEYAILRQAPLWRRLARIGVMPLVGAQVLLVPGLVLAAWRWLRGRFWGGLLVLGWCAAFIAAYAVRLPVIYQHGRYLIPVIPALVGAGVGGVAGMLRLDAARPLPRVLSRVWAGALAAVWIAFLAAGASAYQRDVQIIESEMVATARWVRQNTPSGALVAAHDIGALGYFGGRALLDLAGLVSPEVIPFMRDEAQLRAWLDAARADYLVTFPDWYPELVRPLAGQEIFRTLAPYSPAAGGTNMVVYRWPAAGPNPQE